MEFFHQGLRYTVVTVDAVRAVKAVDLKSAAAGAAREAQKAAIAAAISAIEKRRQFVEANKDGFVLPYFWARYSDEQRSSFLPLARLRQMAGSL